jgi:hypothetical protein
MPTDIRFSLPNTPGMLARAVRAVADAGINVEGIGADLRPGESWGFIHFLVDDAPKATKALEDLGVEILDIHDVDVVEVENRPGSLADLCESYLAQGENIEVLYVGVDNRIIVGTQGMRRPFTGRRIDLTTYSERPTP